MNHLSSMGYIHAFGRLRAATSNPGGNTDATFHLRSQAGECAFPECVLRGVSHIQNSGRSQDSPEKVLNSTEYIGIYDDPPEAVEQPNEMQQLQVLSTTSSPPP